MRRIFGWGCAAAVGVVLAAILGVVGWSVARVAALDVSMSPRPASVGVTPAVAVAPFDRGPDARTWPAELSAVPIERLMQESVLRQDQLDRVEWTGGGIVSCDVGRVLTDRGTTLTVAVPAPFDLDAPVDLHSVSSGQRWPLVYLVAATADGEASVLAEGEAGTAVLRLSWTGANPDEPVPCRVEAVEAARTVTVAVRDFEGAATSFVGVQGCGQTAEARFGHAWLLATERCPAQVVRTIGVATSRSEPFWLDPDGPDMVEVDLPPYPLLPDPEGVQWAFDALAQHGAEETEAALLAVLDALGDPAAGVESVEERLGEVSEVWEVERAGE